MFSINLRSKSLPWKHVITDSTASLVLHKIQNSIMLKASGNEISVRFCTFRNAKSSNLSSKTGAKMRKLDIEKEKSRFVSYLVSSCGFSQESAVSASEKIDNMKNADKPISVIAFFEKHGFSKAQIASIVRKRPSFLMYNVKTLLPKIEFFNSIGVSNPLFAVIASRDPTFLCRSLEDRLIPNYKFLKHVLLTDGKVVSAMNRTSWIFLEDVKKSIAPNIEVLKEFGVLDSCIRLLLTNYPEVLMQKEDELRTSISQVVKLGFDPSKTVFVLALHALSGERNREIWARCYETYTNWGWSEDDIYTAFRKQPNCMVMSQRKISNTMDYLVNKMGWDSKSISKSPAILLYSLENRIVPRCSVMQVLSSRKIGRDQKLSTFLSHVEDVFLERFVFKHADEIPELYDVYKGKVSVEDL